MRTLTIIIVIIIVIVTVIVIITVIINTIMCIEVPDGRYRAPDEYWYLIA